MYDKNVDDDKNDKYCVAPFVGMAVWPHGEIRPCCASTLPLGEFKSTKDFNLAWNSAELGKLRADILQGKPGKGCETCYKAESEGRKSKRQKFNERQNKLGLKSDETGKSKQIQFAEIVFSNSCNLKCLMCNSRYSTKWFADDQSLIQLGLRDPVLEKFQHPFKSNIDLGELIESLRASKVIEILGGEPLIEKECVEFLSMASHQLPSTEIILVSNLTVVPDEVIEAVKQNKNIIVNCSMDGIDEVYSYIRGFSFEKLETNIKRLLTQAEPKCFDLHLSLSVFNIAQLPEVVSWTENLQKSFPKTKIRLLLDQVISDPIYLHPRLFRSLDKSSVVRSLIDLDLSVVKESSVLRLEDIERLSLVMEEPIHENEGFLVDILVQYIKWVSENRKMEVPEASGIQIESLDSILCEKRLFN